MTNLSPITDQIQVNLDFLVGQQDDPDIVALPDGGFVVAYEAFDSAIGLNRVILQQFDENGEPVGDPIIASPASSDGLNHNNPSITVLDNGSWLVAWNTYLGGPANDTSVINARLFSSDGTPSSDIILVSAEGDGPQFDQNAAALADGGFVVAWREEDAIGETTAVYARVFNADGTARTGEFQVDTQAPFQDFDPTVVTFDDGSFLVAWRQFEENGDGTIETTAHARLYNANGVAQGVEFPLFQDVEDTQVYDATVLADGTLAAVGIAWDRDDQGVWHGELVVQGYGSDFQPTTEALVIARSGSLYEPKITATPDGGFAVTVTDDSVVDGNENTLLLRFNADFELVAETQVNEDEGPTTWQDDAAIATLGDGSLAVTWEGEENDDGELEVFLKLFAPQWFGTDGKDKFTGTAANETFDTFDGNDVVKAGKGDDTAKGGKGKDTLKGQAGKDDLDGGMGDDVLDGGKGKDKLTAGKGDDTMTGGEGKDKFIFKTLSKEKNEITDFEVGLDVINLSKFGIGFDDLQLKKIDGGASTRVIYDDFKIDLDNVTKSELSGDDFIF